MTEDRATPCTCPPEVVRWLQLAVDYVKAGGGSEDAVRGAVDVKTFMEQPWRAGAPTFPPRTRPGTLMASALWTALPSKIVG